MLRTQFYDTVVIKYKQYIPIGYTTPESYSNPERADNQNRNSTNLKIIHKSREEMIKKNIYERVDSSTFQPL